MPITEGYIFVIENIFANVIGLIADIILENSRNANTFVMCNWGLTTLIFQIRTKMYKIWLKSI
jgi:hypothetical protein